EAGNPRIKFAGEFLDGARIGAMLIVTIYQQRTHIEPANGGKEIGWGLCVAHQDLLDVGDFLATPCLGHYLSFQQAKPSLPTLRARCVVRPGARCRAPRQASSLLPHNMQASMLGAHYRPSD